LKAFSRLKSSLFCFPFFPAISDWQGSFSFTVLLILKNKNRGEREANGKYLCIYILVVVATQKMPIQLKLFSFFFTNPQTLLFYSEWFGIGLSLTE